MVGGNENDMEDDAFFVNRRRSNWKMASIMEKEVRQGSKAERSVPWDGLGYPHIIYHTQ